MRHPRIAQLQSCTPLKSCCAGSRCGSCRGAGFFGAGAGAASLRWCGPVGGWRGAVAVGFRFGSGRTRHGAPQSCTVQHRPFGDATGLHARRSALHSAVQLLRFSSQCFVCLGAQARRLCRFGRRRGCGWLRPALHCSTYALSVTPRPAYRLSARHSAVHSFAVFCEGWRYGDTARQQQRDNQPLWISYSFS